MAVKILVALTGHVPWKAGEFLRGMSFMLSFADLPDGDGSSLRCSEEARWPGPKATARKLFHAAD